MNVYGSWSKKETSRIGQGDEWIRCSLTKTFKLARLLLWFHAEHLIFHIALPPLVTCMQYREHICNLINLKQEPPNSRGLNPSFMVHMTARVNQPVPQIQHRDRKHYQVRLLLPCVQEGGEREREWADWDWSVIVFWYIFQWNDFDDFPKRTWKPFHLRDLAKCLNSQGIIWDSLKMNTKINTIT